MPALDAMGVEHRGWSRALARLAGLAGTPRLIAFDGTRLRREWIGLICICFSTLCGGAIGLERERRDKPAGMRTIVLIAVGTTIFTILSDLIAIPSPYPPSDSVAICAYAADFLRKARDYDLDGEGWKKMEMLAEIAFGSKEKKE